MPAVDLDLLVKIAFAVGRQGWSLSQLGGWTDRWVRVCGCGAFVAPLWPVRDSLALEFAKSFYSALLDGKPSDRQGAWPAGGSSRSPPATRPGSPAQSMATRTHELCSAHRPTILRKSRSNRASRTANHRVKASRSPYRRTEIGKIPYSLPEGTRSRVFPVAISSQAITPGRSHWSIFSIVAIASLGSTEWGQASSGRANTSGSTGTKRIRPGDFCMDRSSEIAISSYTGQQ